MAQLYSDENFAFPVVEALRTLGHDVLTIADDGLDNQRTPDEVVLQRASELDRVLITFNRKDFIKLHNENQKHAGIVVCTIDPNFQELADRVNELLEQSEPLTGQLLRINRPNP